MGKKKLTPKQELFVKEYLVDLNATQAAIRAGYSAKTARKIGQENLTKPDIAERVKQALDARKEKVDITAERVLKELAEIAFARADDFFEPFFVKNEKTGENVPCGTKIRDDVLNSPNLAAIQSFEPGAYGTKVKMNDKQRALEMLSRHLGLFNADTSHKPETNQFDFTNISSEKLRKIREILKDDIE